MTDRAAAPQSSADPLLSIVVPIYNVESYLDECLESIAGQAVQDFEVIMVDDGSADQSGAIAERWAARDSRFRLVRQDNHGLGHARNSGVLHVAGEYLAFLDSDDRVGEDAYRRMVDTLKVTGSDFATGNVHRFDSSGRTWQAPLYRGMAKTEELATHVTGNVELLRDHLAHNKVWRTSFWRESRLKFPEGVLYEDVPATIPAHVLARAVDVVPVIAVYWRVRDQGDASITQRRGQDARHLRDRVSGMLSASTFIAEHAGQSLKDEYDSLVLRRDLRWYVDLYPDVDAEYQDELFRSIGRYLDQVSPDALQRTPVAMRMAYGLLKRQARDDFATYVGMRRADKVGDLPVSVNGGRAVVDLPLKTSLPEDFRDTTHELKVTTKASRVAIEDGVLLIEGWAYISRLEATTDQSISVSLTDDDLSIPGDVQYRRDQGAAADAGVKAEATGLVAFTARVPVRKLRQSPLERLRRRGGVTWSVVVTVNNGGLSLSQALAKPLTGAAERPLMSRLRDGTWLRVCWTNQGLTCRVRSESALLDGLDADGDAVVVRLRTGIRPKAGAMLRVRRGNNGKNFPVRRGTGGELIEVRVPVPELPDWNAGDSELAWNLLYRPGRSRSWQRVLDPNGWFGQPVSAGSASFVVRRSRAATVDLIKTDPAPSLVGATWGPNASLTLRLAGGADIEAVVFKAERHEETVSFTCTADNGEITAQLDLAELSRFGESVPIRAGTWDLVVRRSTGRYVPIRIGPGQLEGLPCERTHARRRYVLTDRRLNTLSVIVETDLSWSEQGTANQRRLRTEFYPAARGPLQDVVLYESYYGKQFADSPRDIFAELRRRDIDLRHVLAVRDQQVAVPDGATAVPYRSEEYYRLLAQARYIVANTHLPRDFRKADGQTVLQTWHGVGTKKIGLDMREVHFANKSYLENIRNGESDQWDYLVSPNPFTSPILRRAFAYGGRLLETGVPRNDIFHRADRIERARVVKQRLGIDPDRKVVMYAPTWRDTLFDGPGRYRLDLRFDLYETVRKLGDNYVILFRRHSNILDTLPHGEGAVVDASDYPEVQELLLVTDILISDYSTLMCDFANTGRPMLFYTYDLANYRDVVRGFYFDFENEVPGPLISDQSDLVAAIADADAIRAENDAKYQAFAERFCVWDDGHAAERVVDAVFGKVR
jgi:CDP-glycerol glycerophosphotransferase